ncbi:MAG: proline--tRNA ligase [Bacteroidetes bacterium]|nr:proline--tRNA ligase [Bacteroidota bacterium]MCL5026509.1 proline--tRNA ligase [Chloroflexota bacterium]
MSVEKRFVEHITDREEDFSRWYTDVVLKAELADYAPVRGCMVIRPYGYAIWERVQAALDLRIKATGHRNAYFPLFIPESFLSKEAEHVEGFAPEVAWITQGGSDVLEERLAVRPTSETVICTMYAKWIQSWRDLPVLINQWANVVRWEKVTRPFLRTTEFLWQEGHTAHASEAEAREETLRMLEVYREFVETELAIPVIAGLKSPAERFAGAQDTYSIEAMMADGRALQAGTSHFLGQHFARVFDITFLDRDGERKFVYQTSWGVSTRLIGGLVMVHGDASGLIIPPRVAPVEVVVVPIYRSTEEKEAVARFVAEMQPGLCGELRVEFDWREEYTPGYKFADWELRGVPLRLEVGPRDVRNGQVVLVRRDNRAKTVVPKEGVAAAVRDMLVTIQQALFDRALAFREANSQELVRLANFQEMMSEQRGFVHAQWCGDPACEAALKELTAATIRNLPLDAAAPDGTCIYCGKPATCRVVLAKAY